MYRSFTQNNSLCTRLLNKSFSVNLSQSQYLSCHAKPDRTKWEDHMYIEQRLSYAHIAFPVQGTCYGFLQMSGARNQNSRKRLTCKNYIKLANPQINQSPCLHSLFSSVLIHPNRLIYTTAGRLDIHCEAERFLLLVGIFCHNFLEIPNRPKHSVKFVCPCSNYSRSLGWLDRLLILNR